MQNWVFGLILKLKVNTFQNCLNFVSVTFTSKVITKWCWVVLYHYILGFFFFFFFFFLLFEAISQNVVLRHTTGYPRSHHKYLERMINSHNSGPCHLGLNSFNSHTQLMAHNWQKWKRVFMTCPCHKIYSDEAVGLKSCKYTWKIMKFMKMWNLGQYRENLIFSQ